MIPVRRTWLPSVFNDVFGNEWAEKNTASTPAVNIIENEETFKVEVAAPGLTKEDFHLEMVDDNHLLLSMEKKTENKEEKESRYLRREFSYVNFRQRIFIPDDVNRDKIEAKMKDGVLAIDIPKLKEEEKANKSKQICIN